MLVTRVSPISGMPSTRELNITQEQIDAYNSGKLIQDAFPHLSASDREFILTGLTDDEWDSLFED